MVHSVDSLKCRGIQMSKCMRAEAAACTLRSDLPQPPATRSPCGSEQPASRSGTCEQPCPSDSRSGGSGIEANSKATGSERGIASQGLEPAPFPERTACEAVSGAAAGSGQGVAGLGSGAGLVPARTAEYLEPGFWQRRFERGDAHEWFGGYAAFRPLLAPRLTPGRRCVLLCAVLSALCLKSRLDTACKLLLCGYHVVFCFWMRQP